MWYQPILDFLAQSAVTLVIALLGLAVAYGTSYIRKASKRLQEQTDMELTQNLIANLEKVVLVAVEGAEQRVAKDLREAVKEGKAGREQLLAVASAVKRDVLDILGTESIWLLEQTFGDVHALIENYIEAAVSQVKN